MRKEWTPSPSSTIWWLVIGSLKGEGRGLSKNLKTSDTKTGILLRKIVMSFILETIKSFRKNLTSKNFKDLFFFKAFCLLKNFSKRPTDKDK
jgi:hypothetical protein